MKTELLIIKCGDDYIRFKDDVCLLCSFDKASVFPADQAGAVRGHVDKMKRSGYNDAQIKKLVIEEKDFE